MSHFGKANYQAKTLKEKKLDEDRAKCLRMQGTIKEREKKILSRAFIRDADLKSMREEKNALELEQRELDKLKRSIARREEILR